jgi:hypothetical protein
MGRTGENRVSCKLTFIQIAHTQLNYFTNLVNHLNHNQNFKDQKALTESKYNDHGANESVGKSEEVDFLV